MGKIFAYFIYLLTQAVTTAVGWMSRKTLRRTASFIGWVMYIIPGFGSLCRKNIHAAFPEMPDEKVRETALKSLQNLVLTLEEFFWIQRHPEKFTEYLDRQDCEECCLAGLAHTASGKSAILVTPHLGNWEFAGRTLASYYKFRMATVVRSSRNPYLDKLISDGRKSGDVKIIFSKGAAKAMHHAMNDGYAIGILIDQNTRVRHGGVFVNMFGLPVPVSRAPAVLAKGKDCFIAVGTVLRDGDRYRAILRQLPKPSSEYASDEELIQAITIISEEFIRMAPEQYLWMYKRFQYIPPDVSEEVRKRFPDYAIETTPSFYSNAERRCNKKRNKD